MEIELKENERIDDLEFKNLKIIQNTKGFCFGIDAVLLSDFAKNIKKNAKVLDLGTGTGIISILLCGKTNLEKIVGVEVQKEVANMAKRSSKLNNLENKFEIINENQHQNMFFAVFLLDRRWKQIVFCIVVNHGFGQNLVIGMTLGSCKLGIHEGCNLIHVKVNIWNTFRTDIVNPRQTG